MLLPEQVVPFLQHEDALVRDGALRYFMDTFDFGPLTAENYWSVIDRFGENDLTLSFASHLDDVPQTDASLHRLVRALSGHAPKNFGYHYQTAARNMDLPVLVRHRAELLEVPQLHPQERSHLELRLNLLDEPPASAWERLMQHGRELAHKYAGQFDSSLSDALIEAAARGGEPVGAAAMSILSGDSAAEDWRQIFAVRVLGLARYEPAIDTLVDLLAIDANILREETNRSLARIGTVQVIDRIVSFYPGKPWHVRLYASSLPSRIKRPESESALLTFLGVELALEEQQSDEDGEGPLTESVLQNLPELGSLAGLDESRRFIAKFPTYIEALFLCESLLAAAIMTGTHLPEESDWRRIIDEHQREEARNTESFARKASPSRPASLAAAASTDRFDDPAAHAPVQPIRNTAPKIGRNDPCPCGSGKKYKKCCGK